MVWDRRHVETLDPNESPFRPLVADWLAPGLEVRVLSKDESDGSATALVRVPAGWRQPQPVVAGCTMELYVLDGNLTIGGDRFGRNWYSYRPTGFRNEPASSEGGATILAFTYGPFEPGQPRPAPNAIPSLDVDSIPWGNPMTDKKDSGLLSKTLRIDPDSGERLFMNRLEGVAGDPRIEWHPCVEELYAIEGTTSMDHPRDRFLLGPGVYCYRPPGIPHGPFQTDGPVLTIIRVSATLVNYYVDPGEAERMVHEYGPGIDPRMLLP